MNRPIRSLWPYLCCMSLPLIAIPALMVLGIVSAPSRWRWHSN